MDKDLFEFSLGYYYNILNQLINEDKQIVHLSGSAAMSLMGLPYKQVNDIDIVISNEIDMHKFIRFVNNDYIIYETEDSYEGEDCNNSPKILANYRIKLSSRKRTFLPIIVPLNLLIDRTPPTENSLTYRFKDLNLRLHSIKDIIRYKKYYAYNSSEKVREKHSKDIDTLIKFIQDLNY